MNKLSSMLRWSLWHNTPAISVIGGYVIFAFSLSRIFEFPFRLGMYNSAVIVITGAVTITYFTIISIAMIWFYRPSRPIAFLLPRLTTVHRVPQRIVMALPLLLLLSLFFSAFSSFKSAIGVINSYSWDRTFMNLDAALHGGTAPWILLQSVTQPFETFGLAFVYDYLWFPVTIAVLVIVAFSIDRPRVRSQYLVSFFFAWTILGTIGAILFASLGPCFYDLAYPGEINPFEPLMAFLNEVNQTYPLGTLTGQHILREYFLSNQPVFGGGISAFPSMHIAVAVLNAILGWHLSRTAGWFLTILAMLMMIGSVDLGWHYAVDGYASALVVPLIWKLSGITVERWHACAPLVEAANPA
jgi:hypothetical protein